MMTDSINNPSTLMNTSSLKIKTPFCWPSPAKLNLFLYITGQRNDGYHQLQTLFQFLDFGDTLSINVTNTPDINITPSLPNIAAENNLIYKAAIALRNLAQQHNLPTQLGAEITIDKILPMGGGLGGGSSNAATTLIALNEMWQYHFSIDQLAEIGLSLGADVPVFIRGTSAFAENIGEQLSPAEPDEKWFMVIKPKIDISTQEIFTHPDLIRNTPKRPLNELLNAPYKNDCQQIVTLLYPEVAEKLSWLLQYAPSRLTGTGACVFAELDNQAQALSLLERFKKENTVGEENTSTKENSFTDIKNSVFGFIAKGVNISPLHKTLADYKQLASNP